MLAKPVDRVPGHDTATRRAGRGVRAGGPGFGGRPSCASLIRCRNSSARTACPAGSTPGPGTRGSRCRACAAHSRDRVRSPRQPSPQASMNWAYARGRLRLGVEPRRTKPPAVAVPVDPRQGRLADASQPFAGDLEAVGGSGAVESQERRLIEIEPGTAIGQSSQHAIAPPRQSQHVAVAQVRGREPREPRRPNGEVLEALIEEAEDAAESPGELRRRRRRVARPGGVSGDDAGDARSRRFAQPAIETCGLIGQARGAAFRGEPLIQRRRCRRGRFPDGVHPANGSVRGIARRGVNAREVGPAFGPIGRTERRELLKEPCLQFASTPAPVVTVKDGVG